MEFADQLFDDANTNITYIESTGYQIFKIARFLKDLFVNVSKSAEVYLMTFFYINYKIV